MSKLYLATNEDVGDKSLVEALTDKGFDDTPMSKIIDDIGLAIQNKEGTTDYIPASEMAERIANLPSGGGKAIEVVDGKIKMFEAGQSWLEAYLFCPSLGSNMSYNLAGKVYANTELTTIESTHIYPRFSGSVDSTYSPFAFNVSNANASPIKPSTTTFENHDKSQSTFHNKIGSTKATPRESTTFEDGYAIFHLKIYGDSATRSVNSLQFGRNIMADATFGQSNNTWLRYILAYAIYFDEAIVVPSGNIIPIDIKVKLDDFTL